MLFYKISHSGNLKEKNKTIWHSTQDPLSDITKANTFGTIESENHNQTACTVLRNT